MADVDPIVLQISTEFGSVKKDLADLKRQVRSVGGESEKAAKGFDKMDAGLAAVAKKAAVAAAAILSVQAATSALAGSINRGRELTQFASIAGVTRERFSELEVAVRRFGATGDDLSDVMKDLNVRITDAAENGAEYGNVLRKIGLDAAELVRLSPEQQMLEFADALSKANAQGRKFALDELSDSAVKLDRFFAQGKDSIDEMTEGIRNAGQSLTEVDFKKLDEAAAAQQKLTVAFERFSDIITVKLSPYLVSMFDGLSEALEKVTGQTKELGKEMKEAVQPTFALEETVFIAEESLNIWQQYFEDMKEVRAAGSEELAAAGDQYRINELKKEQDAARQMTTIWESGLKGRLEITSGLMKQMSGLMNSESRKMFEVGKAAAIAQVAIDTPKAAMSAYSAMAGIPVVGPALGAIASASAIAAGVAQIQNIRSQSFGGGGVGGGAVDAGGAGGAGGQAQAAPENVIDATFNVQGSNFGDDQVRGMLGSLNELIEDGGKVRSIKVI